MLTIIAPMKSEISYLRQNPALLRQDGAAVQALVVGVGKEAVQRSLSRWLEAPENGSTNGTKSSVSDRLLLLGFAGAVDPALAGGDLLLASRYYLDRDTQGEAGPEEVAKEFFEADSSMLEKATAAVSASGLAWREVDSLTVGRPVGTGEEKAAIYLSHSGRRSVGTVNMEDYWVAEFAARAEIPFLAVRAVIDTADQAIPSYAMGLQERRWSALASAAASPWQFPNLIRLAGNLRLARQSLRQFATAFLQGPEMLADGPAPAKFAEGLDKEENRQPVGTG